jgi:hypothetical protein
LCLLLGITKRSLARYRKKKLIINTFFHENRDKRLYFLLDLRPIIRTGWSCVCRTAVCPYQ